MSLRHTIGSAIQEARILERITREELAERCGIHPYVISSIESSACNLSIDYYNNILSNLKYGYCYRFVKADEPISLDLNTYEVYGESFSQIVISSSLKEAISHFEKENDAKAIGCWDVKFQHTTHHES